MLHDTVLFITLVLMSLLLAVFIYVAKNSSGAATEYSEVQKKAYSIRSKFFWLLLIAGVFILYGTTRSLPYGATKGQATADESIDVVGKQWLWELSKNTVEPGSTVVFNVTSADVNHGFGIYDKDLRLLAQTQAMPGYENKLSYKFKQEGEYKLMCMEYCGLAHHVMISPFYVKSK